MKIRQVEPPPASTIQVKREHHKMLWAIAGVILLLLIVAGFTAWYKLFREVDQNFASIEEQYKYGSIGTEGPEGVPYWIWMVLPRMFPEYLPGPGGYNSLGLYNERGHEMPVGFSKKTIGIDRVGVTCALCHSATIRFSPNEAPVFLTGGGTSTADLLSYQRFLFRSASDPRFTGRNVMTAIAPMYRLSWIDRLLYRYILVPAVKKALLKQKEMYAWTDSRPDWGPGRIDPFNPMKNNKLHVPVGNTVGNSDMVPFWNMRPREGMALHWDGLNSHLVEVVRSSSIGDGATPKTIPLAALQKVQDWILDLKPPKYPADRFPINATLAAAGKVVYDRDCAECHAFGGAKTGKVQPLAQLGTDPNRHEMWRQDAADAYNKYAQGYSWAFSGFRATDGYVNVPLDGIWTRAPYLHNGSVPTLRDLLEAPENRPKVFYRAYNVFEPVKVGFVSNGPEGYRFDTSVRGNSNQGHTWGTALTAKDKDSLVEYMKTL